MGTTCSVYLVMACSGLGGRLAHEWRHKNLVLVSSMSGSGGRKYLQSIGSSEVELLAWFEHLDGVEVVPLGKDIAKGGACLN
jgi:hypothetical protein